MYGVLIHMDIINHKIWIQQDGTEDGVASELVALLIPKQQIVLGFKSENRRRITEFAVS
ncbi:MAG: element excision factor XisI family protein [Microcoleus sp.]